MRITTVADRISRRTNWTVLVARIARLVWTMVIVKIKFSVAWIGFIGAIILVATIIVATIVRAVVCSVTVAFVIKIFLFRMGIETVFFTPQRIRFKIRTVLLTVEFK